MSRIAKAVLIGASMSVAVFAFQTPSAGPQQLAWVDRAGKVLGKIGLPQWLITDVALSPDNTRVAVRGRDQRENDNDNIWVHDVSRSTKIRLTSHPSAERHPMWSPDGTQIVFFSYRNKELADLFRHAADGSGEDQPLVVTDNQHEYYPSWSSDGRYIVYHTHDPKTDNRDLHYIDLKGDSKPQPFVQTPHREALPRFSPDGRYVAYGSDEGGKWEVYVKPFPRGEERIKVSANGGEWPKWSGKGDELFFFAENSLMVAKVTGGARLTSAAPQKLWSGAQAGMGSGNITGFNPTYDVGRDGQRFVVVQKP